MVERDIELALVRNVTKLLLELGTGFAFLGNQYRINVGGDEFFIGLLLCKSKNDLVNDHSESLSPIVLPHFACKSGIYSVGLTQKNIPEP